MNDASYCTCGLKDRDIEAALDAIAAAGFHQTEISGQEPHVAVPPEGRELSEFRARLEGRGLRARTVHAPGTVNIPGAPDEDWRHEKIPILASYLRFAGAIGATEVIMHPAPNPMFVPDADDPAVPGRIRDALYRSLDDLIPAAKTAGVRILFENLPYHCNYPFLTAKELRPLVDAYPEEYLGIIIDTGHVGTLRMDPVAEIHAAGPRLKSTHLQDVDAEEPDDNHWPPTHGALDWEAIRKALSDVRYAGPWSFEVINGVHGEDAGELVRIARETATAWGLR